jgi:hypothetical protein
MAYDDREIFDTDALLKAWRDTELSLPDGIELTGVVYDGPERIPGTEWIAFACDLDGKPVGPEGVGSDPVSALRRLVTFMNERGP